MDKTAKLVIVKFEVEAIRQPCMDLLKVKKSKTIPRRKLSGFFSFFFLFFFCFSHLLLLYGQSWLRWKPPAISHRMLSCWSSSGSNTASHCCNLQINIYGSACSGGLSGSRPSGKIEEWDWLCDSATLPCAPGRVGQPSAKQKCA